MTPDAVEGRRLAIRLFALAPEQLEALLTELSDLGNVDAVKALTDAINKLGGGTGAPGAHHGGGTSTTAAPGRPSGGPGGPVVEGGKGQVMAGVFRQAFAAAPKFSLAGRVAPLAEKLAPLIDD